ncbi:MAG: hypothetical protein M1838_000155 [Thelocarpon superellum]|nr:MAG: hypothetical protein M1838_000155 [Thelocarpon superellum]
MPSASGPESPPLSHGASSLSVKRNLTTHPAASPAKKQSKWSPEEDAVIIDLRGRGMKWEDISKKLPGRSAISCRLHYQNYLERRSEWDNERKNRLARLFKHEMWSKIAEEMQIPWRAAEAMHWQLGEQEMARRAGVVPFSLSSVVLHSPPRGRRGGANARAKRETTPQALSRLPSFAEIASQQPMMPPTSDRPRGFHARSPRAMAMRRSFRGRNGYSD